MWSGTWNWKPAYHRLRIIKIVRSVSTNICNNTSIRERSVKLGTNVTDHIVNIFFDRDTPKCHMIADVSTFYDGIIFHKT